MIDDDHVQDDQELISQLRDALESPTQTGTRRVTRSGGAEAVTSTDAESPKSGGPDSSGRTASRSYPVVSQDALEIADALLGNLRPINEVLGGAHMVDDG